MEPGRRRRLSGNDLQFQSYGPSTPFLREDLEFAFISFVFPSFSAFILFLLFCLSLVVLWNQSIRLLPNFTSFNKLRFTNQLSVSLYRLIPYNQPKMSAEQQDQRPKSSASSKESTSSRKSSDQQRGHQLSDDGPAPTTTAAGTTPDAYQQLSDDQDPTTTGSDEKADKPKKENPLKKFIASLKGLSCTGAGPKSPKNSKDGGVNGGNGEDGDDENTPNARPVSQSSLESKNHKTVVEKSAPQIDVSPAVDGERRSLDGKEGEKQGEEKKEGGEGGKEGEKEKEKGEVGLTTTVISATPPTL
ncbi:hypothetical protein B0T20DRAFT_506679 [Sordaria brevicollis]|uniref:Uncharacterized protein n=1 Tax=Sordaria brevicollis TaxID=83679 RepID=A0AAE0PHA8_SORBR|nr:hypothetical protein B0T20DRAFT_506679 [Sordaria brevicollis]